MISSRSSRKTAVVAAAALALTLSAGVAASQPAQASAKAAAASPAAGKGMQALEQASQAGKYLFVYFHKEKRSLAGALTGGGAKPAKDDALKSQFDAAMAKLAERANSVAVDAADPREKDIVEQFDVARAPMPLVLAIAPNGAVTGGFPGKFTEQELAGAFASPASEKCLMHLQNRKLVFVCIQNAKTAANEAAMRGVNEFKADQRFGQATEIVTIDPSDKAEAKFLAQIKADTAAKQAQTVFLAPPGVALAAYTGATDKDAIIAKLTSSMSSCASGCSPGGCGPARK